MCVCVGVGLTTIALLRQIFVHAVIFTFEKHSNGFFFSQPLESAQLSVAGKGQEDLEDSVSEACGCE